MGLNGEVCQGHKDEATAVKAMTEYLKDLRYAMPSLEDQARELDAHTKRMAASEEHQKVLRERRASRVR